jgi:hypothetical protein
MLIPVVIVMAAVAGALIALKNRPTGIGRGWRKPWRQCKDSYRQ